MGKLYKVVTIAGVLLVGLGCATPVAAITLNIPPFILDTETYDLPPADLAGWFLTFDLSNQWTTASNIATMESWLAVVENIATNQFYGSQLYAREFYGIRFTDSPPPAIWQWLGSGALPQAPQQDFVPEPATLGLLGAALFFFGLWIRKRARRRNTHTTHGSLRSTH